VERKKPRTSSAAKNRYNDKAYDRLTVQLPKGQREALHEAARANGTTANTLLKSWVDQYIKGNAK